MNSKEQIAKIKLRYIKLKQDIIPSQKLLEDLICNGKYTEIYFLKKGNHLFINYMLSFSTGIKRSRIKNINLTGDTFYISVGKYSNTLLNFKSKDYNKTWWVSNGY